MIVRKSRSLKTVMRISSIIKGNQRLKERLDCGTLKHSKGMTERKHTLSQTRVFIH